MVPDMVPAELVPPYGPFLPNALKGGAEVGPECLGQPFAPTVERFELAGEEPQHGRLVDELQAAHQVPVLLAASPSGRRT